MSQWARKRKAPAGFDTLEPTLDALRDELRDRMEDPVEGVKKAETLWPVHQINWQRSRYVYDMYYKYKKISKKVYDYCIEQKLVDAALIAKWKKRGYEKLCSTYVINPQNYPYGTTSKCRVPVTLEERDPNFRDHTTGCRGCFTGRGGYNNIFGNKYGQNLAKIQILREQQELEEGKDLWVGDKQVAEQLEQGSDEDEEEDEDEGGCVEATEEGQTAKRQKTQT
mmetsp:Transcript_14576/g.23723  ORF Transcript_14576/g.23723 Transcript_14576/m.23723 type:complete len:224 (-) Transcript_14576:352-1023(-)